LYNYTNKAGKKSIVKVISVTHDTKIGKDKVWLTKDDEKADTLNKGYASVIFPDNDGKYTSKSREIAVTTSKLEPVKESILSFSEIILEKDRLGKGANVEINKDEESIKNHIKEIVFGAYTLGMTKKLYCTKSNLSTFSILSNSNLNYKRLN
jgi:hypothetical protein